jgi:hypothetical protein
MAETKDDITAERDALRAENENLRGQLAAAGTNRSAAPQHRFVLSEGNRAELVTYGVTNINGRRMTREDVEAELGDGQHGVDLGEATPVDAPVPARGGAVEGVDFIYPSVAPGQIDPAVAGLPGINGPAAK